MFASFGAVLLSVVLVSGQGQFYVNNKDQFWGPDQGNWTVEGDCIIAQMAAQVGTFMRLFKPIITFPLLLPGQVFPHPERHCGH